MFWKILTLTASTAHEIMDEPMEDNAVEVQPADSTTVEEPKAKATSMLRPGSMGQSPVLTILELQ